MNVNHNKRTQKEKNILSGLSHTDFSCRGFCELTIINRPLSYTDEPVSDFEINNNQTNIFSNFATNTLAQISRLSKGKTILDIISR